MTTKLYVGNLSFEATEDEIRKLFEAHGKVVSVRLITDRQTGRARGFAFVEMAAADAEAAAASLDGTEYAGRTLRVDAARDASDSGSS